jgi:hypothetical protein
LRPDWTAGRRSAGKRTQSSRRSMGHRRGHELHRSWSGSSECKAGCAPTRRRPRRRPPAAVVYVDAAFHCSSAAPSPSRQRHRTFRNCVLRNYCAFSVLGTTVQLRVSSNNFSYCYQIADWGAVGSWCPKQAPLQSRILGSWGSSENTEDYPEAVSKTTVYETLVKSKLSTSA